MSPFTSLRVLQQDVTEMRRGSMKKKTIVQYWTPPPQKKCDALVISFLYFKTIQALKCANTLHDKVDKTPTSETNMWWPWCEVFPQNLHAALDLHYLCWLQNR